MVIDIINYYSLCPYLIDEQEILIALVFILSLFPEMFLTSDNRLVSTINYLTRTFGVLNKLEFNIPFHTRTT